MFVWLKNSMSPARAKQVDGSTMPPCATDETPHAWSLERSASIKDHHAHAREIYDQHFLSNEATEIIELGGSIAKNISELFPEMNYRNLDLEESQDVPTIVCDVTEGIPLEDNSIDIVFSNNAFEHIAKPWIAAAELVRILKPGGFLYVSTVWSWRYHPVPIDYWRFSPDCLQFLFDGLEPIECNFNDFRRRNDMRGFWPNGRDRVPTDRHGGWIENWSVFFAGKKLTTT